MRMASVFPFTQNPLDFIELTQYKTVRLGDQDIIATESKRMHRSTVYRLKFENCPIRSNLRTAIVKQQKDDWEEQFEQEIKAYERLDELQGEVIPIFVGQGYFDGHRAVVLSEIHGTTLYDLARSHEHVDMERLQDQLEEALKKLFVRGVELLDPRLDNCFICEDGRVMIVDLEQSRSPSPNKAWISSVSFGNVDTLMYLFQRTRSLYLDYHRPSSGCGNPKSPTRSSGIRC
ncbi:unnamed protein product [Penicillium viridicatum]